MSLFKEYQWRGMLFDSTEGTEKALEENNLTAYVGFDPTASSLHVGNLVPIMGLARLQRAGHSPIAIAGGGTGMIGDPSGKTSERQLLTIAQIEENLAGIRSQLERFLDFKAPKNPAQIINNYDWLGKITYVDFLRDVGKYFTVNAMLSKESVKRRIESEDGITFTEFSYMLLQAYDYLVLYDRYKCTLQMGGSDQWGNIVAGADLIRRVRGKKAYGLVFPLVTTSAGHKFGKTEAGAVWLDAERTSPYRFYQFFLNSDDQDVIKYLRLFSWLSQAEINELVSELEINPHQRAAQRKLAQAVTGIVHGETAVAAAERASAVLFGGSIEGLSGKEISDIFQDVPSSSIAASEFEGGLAIIDLLTAAGVAKSRGEARRLLEGGGIYLNNEKIGDNQAIIERQHCIDGEFLVIRKGRKNYFLAKVEG